mgnify:CR=1 FL=1
MFKGKTKIILNIIFLIIIALVLYFSYKIYMTYHDNKNIDNEIKKVKEEVIINTDIKTEEKNEEPVEANNENNYISEKLTLDFEKLKKINSDTVGWIRINNTNIDYPIVKSTDNKYYLDHSFYKNYNINGWIFENSRNNSNFSDQNTTIFGHNTNAYTMFSELREIYKGKLGTNIKVTIFLENDVYIYQVFSIYLSNPNNTANISEYLNDDIVKEMLNNSKYDFSTTVTSKDKILTLSTCNNVTSDRLIMHAKKIN